MNQPAADRDYEPNALVDKWLPVWERLGLFSVSTDGADGADGVDDDRSGAPPSYILDMFSYPSGDLHMGHAEAFSIGDAVARFARMRGRRVLHPVGWDSFGLPAENAAFQRGLDPRAWTYANIDVQAASFRRLGVSFDWGTRLHTSDPDYYRWTQWLFLRLFERGLAYRKASAVNWCPVDQTVLANEQVIQGHCERCGAQVTKRTLTQWFFRITEYAQRLLDDMAELHGRWPERVLTMQRNWIGRSSGAFIEFRVEGHAEPVRVFTTRPDTLGGATFFVVAPDSPLAAELCAAEQRPAFDEYLIRVRATTEIERLSAERPKTGVFLGRYAGNPLTGERMPVWAADYVLAEYGTGAIMAVPAHDQRDLDFARAMDLPVRMVVDTGEPDPARSGIATVGDGVLVNSGRYDGLGRDEAIDRVTADLAADRLGEAAVTFRLRDWLVSRQRYWGCPIPVVHCPVCGVVPVPDEALPVLLPESGYDLRPDGGRSPLQTAEEWLATDCPRCGEPATRDTDTMDTFVDSSWYYLRYPSVDVDDAPFDPERTRRWLPVEEYVGGVEHAILHLLYSRFITKVLHDMGLVDFVEPFSALTNQGQVIMEGAAMSKSRGNLVNLQDELAKYGPDAVRVTMLFASPPEDDVDWADVSPTGSRKWLARVWRLAHDVGARRPDQPGAAGHPGEVALRTSVHRLVDDATTLAEAKRFNVVVARLMELTTLLRRALDAADPTAADPTGPNPPVGALREGAESLVRMLSIFAPYTAEDAWELLGHPPSVVSAGWPQADPALVAEQVVTCVVQVDGKVRDRLQVPATVAENDLRTRALDSPAIQRVLDGRTPVRVVVRPPRLVNLVLGR